MPRGKRKLETLSRAELLSEAKRLEFTVTSRGCRIGALYHVLRCLMEQHPDTVRVSTPTDETNTLREQLKQARAQLVTAMQTRAPAVESTVPAKADCIVCYDKYDEAEHRPVALNCGHVLCEDCVLKHQEIHAAPTCPSCRTKFTSFIPLFF